MRKQTEKQPIDDLFARKLGNMALPPSPDGFERLQARLGQTKPETKILFWRNPDNVRYIAAAACLLLVCLFGWMYLSTGKSTTVDSSQVASHRPARTIKHNQSSSSKMESSRPANEQVNEEPSFDKNSEGVTESTEQLAQNQLKVKKSNEAKNTGSGLTVDKNSIKPTNTVAEEPVVAQAGTTNKADLEKLKTDTAIPQQPSSSDQPVVATAKPTPATERVLVVTIAEPEALIAARQAAKNSVEEKTVVAASPDKADKEGKTPNLWQQVKRFKQGDVFARGDKEDGESGLLGRAYSGIKHSLEKDKAEKQ